MTIKDMIPWNRGGKNVPIKRSREDDFPLFSLQREMNHLFDAFSRGFDLAPFGAFEDRLEAFRPRLNISENEKDVRVSAELPGMDEKDIEVSLREGSLTIKGEKKDEREETKGGYYRMERSFGSFHRTIPLPSGVDEERADASFKKGVLNITLPKTEEAQRKVKKIEVKTE